MHNTTLYRYLLLLVLAVSGYEATQAQIHFVEDFSWKQLLKEAKSREKLIFVDAFTVWCRPCRKMERQTFIKPQVAEFYNDHFLNVRLNMERGEGPFFAKTYQVDGFPTYLFINSEGKLVHRSSGFLGAEDFIEVGAAALDPQRQLGTLETRYAAGHRDAQLLYHYAYARFRAGQPHTEQLFAYLDTRQDWAQDSLTRKFIFDLMESEHAQLIHFFLKHRATFIAQFGAKEVNRRLSIFSTHEIEQAVRQQDSINFDTVAHIVHKYYLPPRAEEVFTQFKMNYFLETGELERYYTLAQHFDTTCLRKSIRPAPKVAKDYSDMAWTVVSYMEASPAQLAQAKQWIEYALKIHPRDAQLFVVQAKVERQLKHIDKARQALNRARRYVDARNTSLMEMIDWMTDDLSYVED